MLCSWPSARRFLCWLVLKKELPNGCRIWHLNGFIGFCSNPKDFLAVIFTQILTFFYYWDENGSKQFLKRMLIKEDKLVDYLKVENSILKTLAYFDIFK